MGEPWPSRTLLVGIIVSLLLHGAAAWLVLMTKWPTESRARSSALPEDPPQLDQARIELGSPESTAITMTWIGFEQYQEHSAQLSQVEQPALNKAPPGSPGFPSPTTAMEPVAEAARRTASRIREQVEAATRALEMLAQESAELRAQQAVDQGQRSEDLAAADPAQEIAEPQPAPRPEAEQQPSTAASEPGRGDERDAMPTSIITAETRKLGQPLTSRGLKIFTVKPRFTHYTTVTARPRNPVIELHFDHAGKVRQVVLTESSGYPDVDRPIQNAAYRWTAEGEALKGLKTGDPEDTIAIQVRILL
ncbi:MAG: hypothetical protein AAFX05_05005 [Planctomycetota bacterium]